MLHVLELWAMNTAGNVGFNPTFVRAIFDFLLSGERD